MLRLNAVDDLKAEAPERRRDHFPEAPEAEHPAYLRYLDSNRKTEAAPARRASLPDRGRRAATPR